MATKKKWIRFSTDPETHKDFKVKLFELDETIENYMEELLKADLALKPKLSSEYVADILSEMEEEEVKEILTEAKKKRNKNGR